MQRIEPQHLCYMLVINFEFFEGEGTQAYSERNLLQSKNTFVGFATRRTKFS